MIAVSSILRRAVYPAMSRAGLFSRRVRAGDVCVLTYHGVLPPGAPANESPAEGTLVSAEQFRQQLRFLKSNYELITPEAFRNRWSGSASLPRRAVLLTCDDGFLNVLTDMVPILLEEGARCLFFVTGASLLDAPVRLWYEELYRMLDAAPGHALLATGSKSARKDTLESTGKFRFWWDLVHELSRLSWDQRKNALDSLRTEWLLPKDWQMYDPADATAERRHRVLNRTELQQLAANGMTVGAHTMSHPILTQMAPELADREMRECREKLEALLGREVWALAYPFGHEGSARAREMRIAAQAGYTCAFVNYGGGVSREATPRFALPRAHVTANMNLPELEANLTGFPQRFQRWNGAGGKQDDASERGGRVNSLARDPNLRVYDSVEVAEHYANLAYLTPCEQHMFDSHVRVGARILEIGVGGGRVSGYLLQRASSYIGVDYAPRMVAACRQKFPAADFRVADASDLSVFSDGSFDVVVMAFNTIDYLVPDSARARCITEVRRVLKPSGVLIFSSHNPRAVLVSPAWNGERLRSMATRAGRGRPLRSKLIYGGLTSARAALAVVQAAVNSTRRVVQRFPTRTLWHGEGYLCDSVHGGLRTHYWIPSRCIAELASYGFRVMEVQGDDRSHRQHSLFTDWYYYAFAAPGGRETK